MNPNGTNLRFRLNPLRIRRYIMVLALLVLSAQLAGAARRERLIDTWRPLHYNVSLTFNDQLTEITRARAEITVLVLKDRVSEIDFDFGDMPIDSVTIANQSAPYERKTGQLHVKIPKAAPRGSRLAVVVSYHGKPTDGLILTNDKSGKPSAVGDNWPNRVHHWIPSLDHPSAKATINFTVTAPVGNIVVANGVLDKVATAQNGSRTWTYNEGVPIPPYCMIVAVGDFAQLKPARPSLISLTYYVPQSDKALAVHGFAAADPSVKFISSTVGPYPYEKLALIVGATRFGGMENSSAIVFSSTLFDPRPATEPDSETFNIAPRLVRLIAHEIAHQWFGDSVSAATWSDLWLSEGFATYFAALFVQREDGEEAFQKHMKANADRYFAYEKTTRTPLHDAETEDLFKLLNPNNYEKGAWVLHMLRSELGDKNFFLGIRDYYAKHRNATATSEDLRAAFERSSGQDLRPFFKSWVYSAGHPEYELKWKWIPANKTVRLVLKQTQDGGTFPNSLPVEIVTPMGKRRIVVQFNGKQTVQVVKLDNVPSAVTLDPQNTVLKEARVVPESASDKL